jgi:hypothetical protein
MNRNEAEVSLGPEKDRRMKLEQAMSLIHKERR